jgi:hypothetical protein
MRIRVTRVKLPEGRRGGPPSWVSGQAPKMPWETTCVLGKSALRGTSEQWVATGRNEWVNLRP